MVFKRRPHPTAPPRSPQQPSASRAGIPPSNATLKPSRPFCSLSPGTSPTVHGGLWATACPCLPFSLHPACPILPEGHSTVSSSARAPGPLRISHRPPLACGHTHTHTPRQAWPTTVSTEPTQGRQEARELPSEQGPSQLAWAETVPLSQQPLTHLPPPQGGFNYPQASEFLGPPPPSRKLSQPTAHPSSPGERAGGEAAQSRPRLQGSSPCSALPAACPQEP